MDTNHKRATEDAETNVKAAEPKVHAAEPKVQAAPKVPMEKNPTLPTHLLFTSMTSTVTILLAPHCYAEFLE